MKLELLYKCKVCGRSIWALAHKEDQEFLQENNGVWPLDRLPLSVPMDPAHACPPRYDGVTGFLDMVGYRVVER